MVTYNWKNICFPLSSFRGSSWGWKFVWKGVILLKRKYWTFFCFTASVMLLKRHSFKKTLKLSHWPLGHKWQQCGVLCPQLQKELHSLAPQRLNYGDVRVTPREWTCMWLKIKIPCFFSIRNATVMRQDHMTLAGVYPAPGTVWPHLLCTSKGQNGFQKEKKWSKIQELQVTIL